MKANDVGFFLCSITAAALSRREDVAVRLKQNMVEDDVIMAARQTVNPGVHLKKQPSFSMEVRVGRDFKHWQRNRQTGP